MRILAMTRPTAAATPEALEDDMDAEIAQGIAPLRAGPHPSGFHDTGYERAFMIVEADSVQDVVDQFAKYPQVAAGLIEFDYVPVVGLPAIAQFHHDRGEPLPDWWPG